jgi:hypothetical protein
MIILFGRLVFKSGFFLAKNKISKKKGQQKFFA